MTSHRSKSRPRLEADVDLAALLPSWELALRAERKAPHTVSSYRKGVEQYLAWAAENANLGIRLDRTALAAFVADLLDSGLSPATARSRYRAVRLYSAWLAADARPDDVLFGYEPIYLGAWERERTGFSRTVVPRAD